MRNKYLFCYFTGNEPDEESVHFALSENGYHFTALNHNKKIITLIFQNGKRKDLFNILTCSKR